MVDEFLKYVSAYDEQVDAIRFKKEHSLRVRMQAMEIAKQEGFTREECELAELIGLLHDIGRFEQVKLYDSFDDANSIDHAEYGANVLFEEGLIERFTDKKEWYSVVEYAIRNHNKLELPKTSDSLSYKMGKMIRDADKLDIVYLLGVLGNYDSCEDDSSISSEVSKCFFERSCVKNEFVKTNNDKIASTMLLAFDINFDCCLKNMKEYLEAYFHRVRKSSNLDDLFGEVLKYMNERIDKNVRN